jgi:catalase
MSKSILEALYFGKLAPIYRHTENPQREEIEKNIEIEKDYLKEKIPPEDMSHFENLEDLYSKNILEQQVESFAYGFALGTFIMSEIEEIKEDILE